MHVTCLCSYRNHLLQSLIHVFLWYRDASCDGTNLKILCVGTGSPDEAFSMRFLYPAAEFARAKAATDLGVNFDIIYRADNPTTRCDPLDVSNLLGLTSNSIATISPDFLIGPACNSDMKAVAQLSMAKSLFTMTPQAPIIGDILGLSNTINRIGYSLKLSMMPILQMCLQNGWMDVAVIWYQCNPLNKTDALNYIHEQAFLCES